MLFVPPVVEQHPNTLAAAEPYPPPLVLDRFEAWRLVAGGRGAGLELVCPVLFDE
ncbi:hypothetical protein M2161_003587 [Streptomyces sp. SAI-133]|nr:hypothetical protein [Streptomyces sp. SAI-133]